MESNEIPTHQPTGLRETSALLGETTKTPSSAWWQSNSPHIIVALLAFDVFSMSMAGSVVIVPATRILEDILCHLHFDNSREHGGDIEERLCKIDAIQSELAYLLGFTSTIEAIVGLVVAFPYGILADRIGRKPIFVLSVLGSTFSLVCNFTILRFWQLIPVYLILATPIFLLLGGGGTVIIAVIYAIVADVVSSENRASSFFLLAFASMTGNLLGPIISSKLMEIGSPWLPLLISSLIAPLGLFLIVFIPETLDPKTKLRHDVPTDSESSLFPLIKLQMRQAMNRLSESLVMLKTPSLTLILFTYLIQMPLILARGQFFVQYVSKRFEWTIANTGYLLSLRGIVSIFVLLVALPGLSKILLTRFSVSRKDLSLAQVSAAFLIVGTLLLAGSSIGSVISGVIIITFGDGLAPLCRSLITNFIDAEYISRLYTLIGIAETISMLYAGPGLAWLFTFGMKLKGLWLGLPYLWLALMSGLVLIALCFVNPTATSQNMRDFEEETIIRSEEGCPVGANQR